MNNCTQKTRMDDQKENHSKPKRPPQGNCPTNYRRITSLPMMWKILTAQIREKIYYSLIIRGIFPDEQKGCRKRSRATEDLLYTDQHILNESNARRKKLAMSCIYYKKAQDMVPQSWIQHCLKMYEIPDQIVLIIEKTIQTWRVELTAGGQSFAGVMIQRGIFQEDALLPLLFVIAMMPLNHILRKCTAGYKLSKSQEKINYLMYIDDIKPFDKNEKEFETLIQTVRIYSEDIGMEFDIEKCTMLVMKIGKRHIRERVELQNQVVIITLVGKEPTNTWEYWKLTPSNNRK